MSVWGAVAGGFVGTLVLTTALRTAGEAGLTRMDLPFLLGTIVSADRSRAKALGYAMHFVVGQVFAMVYFGIFTAIGHSGWWLGAVFGLAHGVVAGTFLLYIDPEECIDCDACVEACPVDAITAEDQVPPEWTRFIQLNADYYRSARS